MNLEMVLLYLSFNEYRKILEDILEKKKYFFQTKWGIRKNSTRVRNMVWASQEELVDGKR